MSARSGRRHRFFDAAVEEPELLKADDRARRRRQIPNGPSEQTTTGHGGPPQRRRKAGSGPAARKAESATGSGGRQAKGSSRSVDRTTKASSGPEGRKAQAGSGAGGPKQGSTRSAGRTAEAPRPSATRKGKGPNEDAQRKGKGPTEDAQQKGKRPTEDAPRKAKRPTEDTTRTRQRPIVVATPRSPLPSEDAAPENRARKRAEPRATAAGTGDQQQAGGGTRKARRAARRAGPTDPAARGGSARTERASATARHGRTRPLEQGQSAGSTARARSGTSGSGAPPADRSERPGLMRRGEVTEPVRRGRARRGRAREHGTDAGARPGKAGPTRTQSTTIDPRIAARRASVQAEAAAAGTRRRRRLAMVTTALMVVTVAAALVLLSPVAGVRTIEVAGAGRTGAESVRKASGLTPGRPLLRIDEERVRARVARLPWVARVRLERRWPHTVVVTVDERQPAAIAPCQAGRNATCLVDSGGRVLAPTGDVPKVPADLPRLAGVPAAGEPGVNVPDAARAALAVAVSLPPALRPLVLDVRGEGSDVSLNLRAPGRNETPPVVRLGSADRLPDKLTAAATVLARTSVNGVAVLDVRVPESPALTRVRR